MVDEAEVVVSVLAAVTTDDLVTSAILSLVVAVATGIAVGKGLVVRDKGGCGATLSCAVVFIEVIPSFAVVPDAVEIGDLTVVAAILSAVIRAEVVISTVAVVVVAKFEVIDSPIIVVGLLVSSLVGIFSPVLATCIAAVAKVGVVGIIVELANRVVAAVASVSDDEDNWDVAVDFVNLVDGTDKAVSGTFNSDVILLGVGVSDILVSMGFVFRVSVAPLVVSGSGSVLIRVAAMVSSVVKDAVAVAAIVSPKIMSVIAAGVAGAAVAEASVVEVRVEVGEEVENSFLVLAPCIVDSDALRI